MRAEEAIVLGPYVEEHGGRQRYRLIQKSSGGRKSHFYPTLAEARHAKARLKQGDDLSLAALLCLWRGLRVSEVLSRVVRDLDEEGSVLVIERAKTRACNRRVDVPEFLRPFARRLSAGRAPDAWLFRQDGDASKPRHQASVHKRVRSICKRAGVPPICTHSLRGMNATLEVQAGASEDYVARSIGHTSFGLTLRHYVDPTVKATVDAQRVDAVLARVRGTSFNRSATSPSSAQTLLRSLSEEERAALFQALLVEAPTQ